MFQKIIFFLLIFLLIIFQVFFLSNFFPNGNAPSLVILFIIFWTIKFGFEKTLKLAVFSGIILDIFYFWPIGTNVISLVAMSFLTGYLAKRFLVANLFSRIFWVVIIIALATITNDLLNLLIFKAIELVKKSNNSEIVFNVYILREIFYNIIIFAIVYWPLKRIEIFLSLYNKKIEPKYYVK